MTTQKFLQRKKGFLVYAYGESKWFKKLERAELYTGECQKWCHNVQIIDCTTGKMISGKAE